MRERFGDKALVCLGRHRGLSGLLSSRARSSGRSRSTESARSQPRVELRDGVRAKPRHFARPLALAFRGMRERPRPDASSAERARILTGGRPRLWWKRGNGPDDAAVGSFTVRNPDCPRAFGRPDPGQPRHSHPGADQRRTSARRRACERGTEDSSPASDRTRASECLTRSTDSSCKTSHLFSRLERPAGGDPAPIAAGSLALRFRRLPSPMGIDTEATRLDDVSLTRASDHIRPARYSPIESSRSRSGASLTATGPLRRVGNRTRRSSAWLKAAVR